MIISKKEWEDLRMKVRTLEEEVDNLQRDKVKDRLKELSEKYKISIGYYVAFYEIDLIDESNSKVIKTLLREWDATNMYKRIYEKLISCEVENTIKAYKYDLMEAEKKEDKPEEGKKERKK